MENAPCPQDSEFFTTLGVLTSKFLDHDFEELKTGCEPAPELTEQENDDLCRAFTLLDVDGDGVIGTSEIEDVLVSCGRLPFNENLVEVMQYAKSVGVEGTRGMGYDEFKKYVVKHLVNTDNEKELRDSFEVFDTTPPTGKVDLIQLRKYLKNEGLQLTDDEIDFLYKEEDYWMLDDKPMFEYDKLVRKILDLPMDRCTFLDC